MEAGDLNEWLNEASLAPRLLARTASFCFEHAPPHRDDGGFTQGLATFLPNTTFLQPPGHVHAMLGASWLPHGLSATWHQNTTWHSPTTSGRADAVTASAATASPPPKPSGASSVWNASFSVSAGRSASGKRLVVRLVSRSDAPVSVQLEIAGVPAWPASRRAPRYVATLLSAPSLSAINTAGEPRRVAPEVRPAASLSEPLAMPPHSFAVVQVEM